MNIKLVGGFKLAKPRIVIAACEKNGVVFTGLRHGDCIRQMVQSGFISDQTFDYVKQSEQGFVDNHNHYWSRDAARIVAIGAGQIDETHGTLYSEDLW